MTKLAVGAASGLLSTLLNGTALWFLLEWYRQLATNWEITEGGDRGRAPLEGEGLVVWQVVFYVTMLLSVCTTVLLAGFLARRFRTPAPPTIVFTLFLVGLVAYPFLVLESFANDCVLKDGFPLGAYCD